jgi:hypothetical protein
VREIASFTLSCVLSVYLIVITMLVLHGLLMEGEALSVTAKHMAFKMGS